MAKPLPTITATRHTKRSGSRTYTIGGRTYPSMTTGLGCLNKAALVGWAANTERAACLEAATTVYTRYTLAANGTPTLPASTFGATMLAELGTVKAHQKALAEAAEIGTAIHAAIEYELKRRLGLPVGVPAPLTDQALWAFMAWEDWAKAVELRPVLVEQVVYSERYGYAGTLDCLAYVRDVLTVCDWKSGKAIYGEAFLQNVGYQQAANEMGLGPVQAGVIVRVPKVVEDPLFEAVDVPALESLLPVVAAIFQVVYPWYARNEAEGLAKWRAARDAQKEIPL